MIPVFSSENAIKEEKKIPGSSSCYQFVDVLICAHAVLAFSFPRRWGGAGEICKGLLNGLSDIFV